jgi:hypothetical protein
MRLIELTAAPLLLTAGTRVSPDAEQWGIRNA